MGRMKGNLEEFQNLRYRVLLNSILFPPAIIKMDILFLSISNLKIRNYSSG